MSKMYKIRDFKTILELECSKSVPLKLRTDEYIILPDRVIVYHYSSDIQKTFPEENPGRNIWCYDLKGNLLWRIEESPRYFDWVKRGVNTDNRVMSSIINGKVMYSGFDNRRDPYTGLVYNEKEDKIYTFVQGRRYDLDPETGKVGNFMDNIK